MEMEDVLYFLFMVLGIFALGIWIGYLIFYNSDAIGASLALSGFILYFLSLYFKEKEIQYWIPILFSSILLFSFAIVLTSKLLGNIIYASGIALLVTASIILIRLGYKHETARS